MVTVERRDKYSYYSISSEDVANIIRLAISHATKYSQSILSCNIIKEETIDRKITIKS